MATLTLNEIHNTNKFFQTSPFNNIESKTANYRKQLEQVQENAEYQKEKLDSLWLKQKAEQEQSEYLFTLYNNVMDKLAKKEDINPIRKNPPMVSALGVYKNPESKIPVSSVNSTGFNSGVQLANINSTLPSGRNSGQLNENRISNLSLNPELLKNRLKNLKPTSTRSSEEAPPSNDSERASRQNNLMNELRLSLESRRGRRGSYATSLGQITPRSSISFDTPRNSDDSARYESSMGVPNTPPSAAQRRQRNIGVRELEELRREGVIPQRERRVGVDPGSALAYAPASNTPGSGGKKKKTKRSGNILFSERT